MAGDRVPRRGPRRGVPRPPVHDPAHAPDRGVAPARRGRPVVARADRRGVVEHDRAARAVAAVQHDGRPARAERRDHPPRPRLQPRLPGRRQPRAADADRRDAHVHRAAPGPGRARPRRAGRVPRLVRRPARPARLARPEPARALEARLRPRAAGPAPGRRAGHDRVRRRAAAARRGAQGPRADDVPAAEPAPDPPRPAAASARSSPTSSATRSSSRSTDGSTSARRQLPDGGARIEVVGHGRRHPAGRAAPDLRPLLPRLRRQRGPRHGLRPGPGDREVDRGHAPRDDRGREPGRGRVAVRGAAAARPARGRARSREPPGQPTAKGRRIFTQRRPGDESRSGTLDGTPRPPRRRHHRASQREDPRSHERRSRGGRSPGRRPTRSARRHAARRGSPLRADPRSATRRPVGLGVDGRSRGCEPVAGSRDPAAGAGPAAPGGAYAAAPPTRRARHGEPRPFPRPHPPGRRPRPSPPRPRSRAAGAPPASGRSSRSRCCRPCSPRAARCSSSSAPAPSTSAAPASTIATGTQTGSQQPVTIDESSAVIDAAAKVGPAVVKIDTGRRAPPIRSPSRASARA